MDNGIHFISGLPRSGSSLLSAILLQNPRFHAGISSPVAGLFQVLTHQMSENRESAALVDEEARREVLSGLFDNYYFRQHPSKVVFDTNRFWASKAPALGQLFPASKMICCVRHVPWIIDSLERLHHRNGLDPSAIYNFDPAGTVYSRFDANKSGSGLVGYAWNATREAFYGGNADRLMLLTYETLVAQPEKAMSAVYEFLGERDFDHDFDHVELDASEFDKRFGARGLHSVRNRVTDERRSTVLPPDIWLRVEQDSFWRRPALNPNGVKVV